MCKHGPYKGPEGHSSDKGTGAVNPLLVPHEHEWLTYSKGVSIYKQVCERCGLTRIVSKMGIPLLCATCGKRLPWCGCTGWHGYA